MKRLMTLLLLAISQSAIATEKCPGLEERWNSVVVDIASITDGSGEFGKSVWGSLLNLTQYSAPENILVAGDANQALEGFELIHICGDAKSDIALTEHSELVIAGDVKEGANIRADGITRVYVGGAMEGVLEFSSMTRLYVAGDLSGRVKTGSPHTRIFVNGNLSGEISPSGGNGGFLSIEVQGITTTETIHKIYKSDYTELVGVFDESDAEPGIYSVSPLQSYYVIRNQIR